MIPVNQQIKSAASYTKKVIEDLMRELSVITNHVPKDSLLIAVVYKREVVVFPSLEVTL